METVWETQTERVRLVIDESGFDYADPRQDDNLGVMAARGNRNYDLGDDTSLTREVHEALLRTRRLDVVERWLRIFHGATVVLPLGLIDHSGISMYVGAGAHVMDPGGWDSGLVGLIFDTAESRELIGTPPEHVESVLRDEVAEYDRYLRGEVYGAVYERLHTWTRDDGVTRQTWEAEDSVWGMLGYEHAESSAHDYFPEPTKV